MLQSTGLQLEIVPMGGGEGISKERGVKTILFCAYEHMLPTGWGCILLQKNLCIFEALRLLSRVLKLHVIIFDTSTQTSFLIFEAHDSIVTTPQD